MDRLTEMEAFATVVDQGGFTDAAKKMGISKSAVSKHVSSLEARLGARLLNRTTRRVSPTEIGLAYYDRARRVLNDAGEADALVTSMQSAPSGLLRISVATDFGVNHLSPVLGEFLQEYPGHHGQHGAEQPLRRTDLGRLRHGHPHRRAGGQHACAPASSARRTRRMIASPSYFQQVRAPAEDRRPERAQAPALLQPGQRQRLEADRALGREAAGAHRRLADGE